MTFPHQSNLFSLSHDISPVMWWLMVMWIPCHLLAEYPCVWSWPWKFVVIGRGDSRWREVIVIFSSALQHSQRTSKVGIFCLKTKIDFEKRALHKKVTQIKAPTPISCYLKKAQHVAVKITENLLIIAVSHFCCCSSRRPLPEVSRSASASSTVWAQQTSTFFSQFSHWGEKQVRKQKPPQLTPGI